MNFLEFNTIMEGKLRTHNLRRGTILYHGTSVEEDFDVPDAPAWFSTSESVARQFIGYHSYS